MNLYELAEQYEEIVNMPIETEEDWEEFARLLDDAAGQIEEKVCSIGYVIRTLVHHEAAVAIEIDWLKKKRQVIQNKVARLKQYAREGLEAANLKKATDGIISVRRQQSPGSVVITAEVPHEYMRVKEEVDKSRISEELKAGQELPFAHLARPEIVVVA